MSEFVLVLRRRYNISPVWRHSDMCSLIAIAIFVHFASYVGRNLQLFGTGWRGNAQSELRRWFDPTKYLSPAQNQFGGCFPSKVLMNRHWGADWHSMNEGYDDIA